VSGALISNTSKT